MTTPPADGMPTTRGTNLYLADPHLAFVGATVMGPDDFERARPHLIAMGEVAGGELDALAAVADRHPPVLRTHDERGRQVDEIVRHPAYQAMERIAFERFGLAAMSHREGVLGWPGRVPHVVKYATNVVALGSGASAGARASCWPPRSISASGSARRRRPPPCSRRASASGWAPWSTGRRCPSSRWRSRPEAAEIRPPRELPAPRPV